MVAQFHWGQTVNFTMPNITQVVKPGGKPGKGLQYMNIGWQKGCTAFTEQYPDNPLGKSGDDTISYTTILEEIAYNCEWYPVWPVRFPRLLH